MSGFWNHRPDYFAWLDGDGYWGRLSRTEKFEEEYEPVAHVPGDDRYVPLTVYRRRNLPQQVARHAHGDSSVP